MGQFTLIRDDNTVESIEVNLPAFQPPCGGSSFISLEEADKIAYIRALIEALDSGKRVVLFDTSMVNTAEKAYAMTRSASLETAGEGLALFFTSGTTGNPVGVLKEARHIDKEVEAHRKWLEGYTVEQCLVCVPFFHIYGFLFGLALPLALDLDIVTQDHFLPGDIIRHALQKPTLCIANPVFIRAMNRVSEGVDLGNSVFVCSAGALEPSEASAFESKYRTKLVQLYGSTETGGIAIREGGESRWRPLEGVEVREEEGRLSVRSPYLSEYVYQEGFAKIAAPYVTTDLVRIDDGGFEIIGRESELIKIGGKRLSVIEIERYLETLEGIEEALVMIEYRPLLLRGEILHLRLLGEAKLIDAAEIKKRLHDRFGGIHIECKIVMVDEIAKTATGKKIRSALSLA